MNLHYNFTVILLHLFTSSLESVPNIHFFCLHLPYNQQCLVGKTLNKTRIRANVFIDPKTYVGPFDILNLEFQALN